MRQRGVFESVGDLVRRHRIHRGMTQDQLAALAGISGRSLRAIERDQVAKPRDGSLFGLARALELTDAERTQLVDAAKQSHAKPSPAIAVSILGPLRVTRHGHPVAITSAMQQLLIGLLALEGDRLVTVEEIADVLWGSDRPSSWRNRIQSHLVALRSILDEGKADSVVASERDGYRLRLPTRALDTGRFQTLLDDATACERRSDHGAAIDLYEEALACWRGRVLSGFEDRVSARPATQALQRIRLSATIAFADLATSVGHATRTIAWLADLTGEETLHEALHIRYMTGLAACGQQDQALQVYHELRDRLSTELGVYPGDETQAAYRGILQAGAGQHRARHLPTPAQLPFPPAVFGGRDDATNLLIGHLRRAPVTAEIPGPRIVVVHGMPGVGKTALALRVSHAIRSSYPDGQLFADLRGESEHPTPPAIVLAQFLRALGVPASDVPSDMDERASMLRTYLAGRRVLLMLDDARSGAQVMPLLPATAGNDVLITSRSTLIDLPVTRLALAPLSTASSLTVFGLYLPDDVTPLPEAGSRIAAYCGGLPLALRIAAGRVANGEALTDVADTLRTSKARLTELKVGPLAFPASLESAYRALSPSAQTALRSLALLPTRTLPGWTTAIAADLPPSRGEQVNRELVDAHLLNPVGSATDESRYRFHDLVRLFGASIATAADQLGRDQAILHWLHIAEQATTTQSTRRLQLAELPGLTPLKRPFTPAVDAETWFQAEYTNILDLIQHATDSGQTRVAAGLLNAVSFFLRTRFLVDESLQHANLILDATADGSDPVAHAYACEARLRMELTASNYPEALSFADRSLAIFTALGDHKGQALIQYHRQYLIRRMTNQPDEAIQILKDLIAREAQHSDASLLAAAHQALGVIHREYLQDVDGSIRHLEAARTAHPDPTTREYDQILFSLAKAYLHKGRQTEAEPLLTGALRLAKTRQDHSATITILTQLSKIWDPVRAAEALNEAEALAATIEQPWYQGNVHRAWSRLAEGTGDILGAVRATEKAIRCFENFQAPQELENAKARLDRLRAKLTPGDQPASIE